MPPGIEFPPETRARFLAALALTGHVGKACDHAEVSVATVYRWRQRDDDFRVAWQEIIDSRKELRAQDAWHANDNLVHDPLHKDHHAAVKLAIEKNDPDARPTLEITGQVTVGHEARLTLAHVAGLADRLGLSGRTLAELPAARELIQEDFDAEGREDVGGAEAPSV